MTHFFGCCRRAVSVAVTIISLAQEQGARILTVAKGEQFSFRFPPQVVNYPCSPRPGAQGDCGQMWFQGGSWRIGAIQALGASDKVWCGSAAPDAAVVATNSCEYLECVPPPFLFLLPIYNLGFTVFSLESYMCRF